MIDVYSRVARLIRLRRIDFRRERRREKKTWKHRFFIFSRDDGFRMNSQRMPLGKESTFVAPNNESVIRFAAPTTSKRGMKLRANIRKWWHRQPRSESDRKTRKRSSRKTLVPRSFSIAVRRSSPQNVSSDISVLSVSGTRFPDFVALSLARATQTRAALPILPSPPHPALHSACLPGFLIASRVYSHEYARAHTRTHLAAPDHVFERIRTCDGRNVRAREETEREREREREATRGGGRCRESELVYERLD